MPTCSVTPSFFACCLEGRAGSHSCWDSSALHRLWNPGVRQQRDWQAEAAVGHLRPPRMGRPEQRTAMVATHLPPSGLRTFPLDRSHRSKDSTNRRTERGQCVQLPGGGHKMRGPWSEHHRVTQQDLLSPAQDVGSWISQQWQESRSHNMEVARQHPLSFNSGDRCGSMTPKRPGHVTPPTIRFRTHWRAEGARVSIARGVHGLTPLGGKGSDGMTHRGP